MSLTPEDLLVESFPTTGRVIIHLPRSEYVDEDSEVAAEYLGGGTRAEQIAE